MKITWLFFSVIALVVFNSSCSTIGISQAKKKEFTLATWNIGHYSNGKKPYSLIDISKDGYILNRYSEFLYQTIAPDVIAVNEYSKEYYIDEEGQGHLSSKELFDGFRWKIEGPQEWGICNAIFSRLMLVDNEKEGSFYYSNSQKGIQKDERVSNRENYFLESEIVWKGKTIKIVCVHLLFSTKTRGVFQQAQIRELIDRYSQYERVIICGDWNTGNNNYKLLKEAGFVLANNGTLVTYPSKNYPLDNIAVKGVKISDVRAVQTDLSDHYPLVCKISL